jgi:hypothetical protein
MKRLFLSWSGEPSKTVALALKQWLPSVVHALDPWVSHEDIGPGVRWSSEVSKALADTEFGIICVTDVNQSSSWLNFEVGALANSLDQRRVFPYLISMNTKALVGPLAEFQAVLADRDGTFSLLKVLNGLLEKPLETVRLTASFDKWWPDLSSTLSNLPHTSRELESSGAKWPLVRTKTSLLEVVANLSEMQRRLILSVISSHSHFGGAGSGLYPHMLEKMLGIGRGEIVYRCKDLERLQLIDVMQLTDLFYSPARSLFSLLDGMSTSDIEEAARTMKRSSRSRE